MEHMEEQQPFKSLIAASSLVTALLYVAGFAYRWTYYYNFGVPELVYEMNIQSFFFVAMELIRTPGNFLKTFGILGACLAVFEALALYVRRIIMPRISISTSSANTSTKSGGNLLIDSLRAILIVSIIYSLSSQLGYKSFLNASIDSERNPRPRVILIDNRPSALAGKAACGSDYNEAINVIGSRKQLRLLLDSYATCSSTTSGIWRLLHRDSNFIYLFASSAQANRESDIKMKPRVFIIPNSSNVDLFFW
jgi:hypothetical protein